MMSQTGLEWHVWTVSRGDLHDDAQEMRTWQEAEQAGKSAGLELVTSIDIAVASPVAGPWCDYLLYTTSHGPLHSVQANADNAHQTF